MNCEIQHPDRCHEKRLPEGPIVDGFLPPYQNNTHSKGIILQLHGCYWPGCLRCYRINKDTRLVGNESMDYRYERTCKISEKIRSYNYYLIEKWECEYKKDCLENESMSQFIQEATLAMQESLNPRDDFFGCRTGNRTKVYDAHGNQKIKYIDVCSLYPYICKVYICNISVQR